MTDGGGAPSSGGSANAVLYNSMIAPYALGPMAMKGVLWYQGESNSYVPDVYWDLFPRMIQQWREKLGRAELW